MPAPPISAASWKSPSSMPASARPMPRAGTRRRPRACRSCSPGGRSSRTELDDPPRRPRRSARRAGPHRVGCRGRRRPPRARRGAAGRDEQHEGSAGSRERARARSHAARATSRTPSSRSWSGSSRPTPPWPSRRPLIAETNAEGSTLSAEAKRVVAEATAAFEAATRDRAAVAAASARGPGRLLRHASPRAAPARLCSAAAHARAAAWCSPAPICRRCGRRAEDAVVTCPECGCILVRTEESGL